MELYNPGATDIDMSGYYFTQGVTHTFADGTTLPAGGYILLTMPTANGDVDYNVYDPDGDGFHEMVLRLLIGLVGVKAMVVKILRSCMNVWKW